MSRNLINGHLTLDMILSNSTQKIYIPATPVILFLTKKIYINVTHHQKLFILYGCYEYAISGFLLFIHMWIAILTVVPFLFCVCTFVYPHSNSQYSIILIYFYFFFSFFLLCLFKCLFFSCSLTVWKIHPSVSLKYSNTVDT